MRARRKTWTDKLADPRPPVIKPAPIDIAGMKAGQIMLVPTAAQLDARIRAIPRGHALDLKTLRASLALANGAEVTCPITLGFCMRIVAEAAWEALERGTPIAHLTPVWRVLDAGSPTLAKLSFDTAFIRTLRELEGLSR